jgi:hypothetical protein
VSHGKLGHRQHPRHAKVLALIVSCSCGDRALCAVAAYASFFFFFFFSSLLRSLEAVVGLCLSSAAGNELAWTSTLQSTNWLVHVRGIRAYLSASAKIPVSALLHGSSLIASTLHQQHQSAFVHCSDGSENDIILILSSTYILMQ